MPLPQESQNDLGETGWVELLKGREPEPVYSHASLGPLWNRTFLDFICFDHRHDGCSLPPTRAGKAPCVALDVTAPSLSDLRRVYGLEKPPAFSSCISPIKELIPCSTSRFTASPHPSCQGCFFFLVFRGEHFPHFAILIWTPGLEITARNCKNGLTFIVLTRCLLSTIDLFKKGYKPELWNSPEGPLR